MERRFQPGFTLIELLVVLAIAAIMLAVAAPGFNAFFAGNRAEVQVQSLVGSLNLARSEAVKRNGRVVVEPAEAGVWEAGWNVWWDSNQDGAFNGDDIVLRSQPALTGEATLSDGGAGSVAFTRMGAAESAADFEYRLNADQCRRERDIRVNTLGRVTTERRACS